MQYCVSVEARRTGHEEALFTTWDQFQPTTIGNRLAVLLIRCWPPILCFFNAGSQNQCVGRFWKRSNLGLRRLASGEVCVNSLGFVVN